MGTTATPNSFTESQEFISYIQELNRYHQLPNRGQATQEVQELAKEGKTKIFNLMNSSFSKIHLTADIWSKKGLTSSYLGITAQFVVVHEEILVGKKVQSFRLEDAVLELIDFPNPHTGIRIAIELLRVLREWKIMDQLGFILCDSGANMIRAFKDAQNLLAEQEVLNREEASIELDPEAAIEPGATTTAEVEPATGSSTSDEEETDEIEGQDRQDEDEYSQDELEENTMSPSTDVVQSILDLDPLVSEDELRAEITAFTGDDSEANGILVQNGLKRIPCYSHKLQLVVAHFDVFRQRSTSSTPGNSRQRRRGQRGGIPGFAKIIVKGKKLVAKFNKSCVATTRLVKLTNKKLTSDVCTRWSSTFLMLDRLVKLKDAIDDIQG